MNKIATDRCGVLMIDYWYPVNISLNDLINSYAGIIPTPWNESEDAGTRASELRYSPVIQGSQAWGYQKRRMQSCPIVHPWMLSWWVSCRRVLFSVAGAVNPVFPTGTQEGVHSTPRAITIQCGIEPSSRLLHSWCLPCVCNSFYAMRGMHSPVHRLTGVCLDWAW